MFEREVCMLENNRNENDKAPAAQWISVATVANDIEFEITAGLLKTAGIPVIRKVKGVDGHILGAPSGGIDIIVPEDRYEEVMKLLNYEDETNDNEAIDN
jgi:hypothetical protein